MSNEIQDIELNIAALKQEVEKLKSKLKEQDIKCHEYQQQHELVKEEQTQLAQELTDLQSNKNLNENELDKRAKQLEHELSASRSSFLVEEKQHDDKIKALEEKLQLLVNEHVEVQDESFKDNDENLQLENKLLVLCDELSNQERIHQKLEAFKLKLMENNEGLQTKLEELTVNFECKKAELKEARELLKNMEDEKMELTLEIEAAKTNSFKPVNTENSLFGEVNERRLKMRDELVSLDEKCKKLNAEVTKIHKHMTALKLHNMELNELLKTQPEENRQDYETLTDVYLKRISMLGELHSSYQTALKNREELLANKTYQNAEEFIKHVTERFMKEENKLKDMTGMEFRAQKMMSFRLKELETEIQKSKNLKKKMEAKISEMKDYFEKQKLALNAGTKHNKNTNGCVVNSPLLEESKENKKENVSPIAPNEKVAKKVMFSAEALTKPSSSHTIRKGAKVIQSKSKHISSKK